VLDGKGLGPRFYSTGTSLTNPIGFAREISHQALHVDFYDDYYSTTFDLHSSVCSGPSDTWRGYNAWKRLRLGWITPTVVTRDQFYRIGDAAGSGDAYILYDHGKNAKNFLLVENRERTGYDRSVPDEGLVVWRVDESRLGDAHPVDLVSPVADRFDFAWDPSDPATPGRTATTPWFDGSASNVAVRAIGDRGGTMWAYLDVRGPGILVDAYALKVQHATAGVTRTVTFPVRNTGETTDSFVFTLTDLPAGWTSTVAGRTLAAGEEASVTVQVTPAATSANGLYGARAFGKSTTKTGVNSDSLFGIALP
jgi:hypothetical protein